MGAEQTGRYSTGQQVGQSVQAGHTRRCSGARGRRCAVSALVGRSAKAAGRAARSPRPRPGLLVRAAPLPRRCAAGTRQQTIAPRRCPDCRPALQGDGEAADLVPRPSRIPINGFLGAESCRAPGSVNPETCEPPGAQRCRRHWPPSRPRSLSRTRSRGVLRSETVPPRGTSRHR
jgi:hypothetical protein